MAAVLHFSFPKKYLGLEERKYTEYQPSLFNKWQASFDLEADKSVAPTKGGKKYGRLYSFRKVPSVAITLTPLQLRMDGLRLFHMWSHLYMR